MKRLLLITLLLNTMSIAFCQSENNKETIEDFEIEPHMTIEKLKHKKPETRIQFHYIQILQ